MSRVIRHATASWRLLFVSGVLCLAATVIGARLVWLHIIDTDKLKDRGDEITIRRQPILPYRGMITDRMGEPLAVSTPVARVGVRASALESKWAERLAPLLNTEPDRLLERVSESKSSFLYLSRYVIPEDAATIKAAEIPGVVVEPQFRRFYPATEVASHLVGFTNIDDQGQEGLERAYDQVLAGTGGYRHVLRNRRANVVRLVTAGQEVEHGQDLRLSVDLRAQYLVYRALKEAVVQSGASTGSAVLIDAWTGEVLALAAQPSFNPNQIGSRVAEAVRNRAVMDVFEPGSSVKPFTIATALDLGVITPEHRVDTSPGRVRVQGHVVSDASNYGEIDLTQLMLKSSNVGTLKIEQLLNPTDLRERLAQLGLGQTTGTGFPNEAAGRLPAAVLIGAMDRAALSFGYGLQVTTLQLAQAFTVFANQGVLQPVTLLSDGHTLPAVQVFSKETVTQILPMLEAVTRDGGTAQSVQARVPLYRVGGKTGTTEKASPGGYGSLRYVASFVGLAPMSKPRFVMAVMIDDPQSQRYGGGAIAAPVFAEVIDDVLRLYGVAPDMPSPLIAGAGTQ